MFKFEVDKLYRIGGDMGRHIGKVIRITDCKPLLETNLYSFKMVHGEPMSVERFMEKSVMAQGLIPVREMIVIYRNDNKVVALDKATGKEGVARCSPEDTFDFETGAKLAFKRLVGEDTAEPVKPEAPKFKVGEFVRVVSAENGSISEIHGFPIGQIVKVVDVKDSGDYICEGVYNWVNYRFGTQIVNPNHIEKLEEA